MIEKITLDMLMQNHVSVINKKYIEVEGEQINISTHRIAYDNNNKGRQQVQHEVPEPYKTAIFAVWGDVPTVLEKEQWINIKR